MSSKMIELAKEAGDLKEKKTDLEAKLKAVGQRLSQILDHELPEIMEDQEVPKFSVDGIGTIFLRTEVYSNVRKDDRETFYSWLRENGHEDLIVPWVFPATQKAFIKEQLNEGNPLPEFLDARFIQKATIRSS